MMSRQFPQRILFIKFSRTSKFYHLQSLCSIWFRGNFSPDNFHPNRKMLNAVTSDGFQLIFYLFFALHFA